MQTAEQPLTQSRCGSTGGVQLGLGLDKVRSDKRHVYQEPNVRQTGQTGHVVERRLAGRPTLPCGCQDYSVKWYYNTSFSRCERFWYGGCGGNGNKFDTEEQCKAGCVDLAGPEVCRLPSEAGPCRAIHRRYFYNHKVGKCELFTYGGCRGNANRFKSAAECEKKCAHTGTSSSSSVATANSGTNESTGSRIVPSHQVEACRDTRYGCCSDGTSAAAGPNKQGCPADCETSRYGCCEDGVTAAQGPSRKGCGEEGSGQDGDCDDTRHGCCPDGVTAAAGPNNRGCPVTTTTTKTTTSTTTTPAPDASASRCSLPSARGPCSNYIVRWSHDSGRKECTQFWYGGCQGNDNRFETRDECEAECMATEAPVTVTEDPDFVSICDMPVEIGTCRARLPRWHYSPLDRQCRIFFYSGCHGNENNFESLPMCQQTCMGIAPREPTTTATTTTPMPYTFMPPPVKSSLTMTGTEAVLEGKELKLICRAQGPTLPSQIEWFINGKRVDREQASLLVSMKAIPSEHALVSELLISSAHKDNTATYYCRSLPFSDVQRKAVIVSKEMRPTTPAPATPGPPGKPDVPDRTSVNHLEVCGMPQESGSCRAYFRRWFYDMNLKQCRQFVYGGCGGNSNNFETQKECENYCRSDVSVRPTTPVPPVKPDVPDRTSVNYLEVCGMPQESGSCRAYFRRWFYDRNLKQCRQFVYGGCDGNSNNFETQEECENYCRSDVSVRPTTPVPPVKPDVPDRTSVNYLEVCRKPQESGPCRAYLRRWFYDMNLKQCHQFVYGGCDGNSNNFETQKECENYCRSDDSLPERTSQEEVCNLPSQVGHCKGNFQRWYYDAGSRTCRQFVYGGCSGNSNNFESEQDCLGYCRREVGSRVVQVSTDPNEVCQLPLRTGNCGQKLPRYHYNSEKGKCLRFDYSGCDGNDNNFESEEACDEYCKTEDICKLPLAVGPCRASLSRYHYDSVTETCRQFNYGGCQGNLNNFGTLEACQRKCVDESRAEAGTATKTKEVCSLNPDGGRCHAYIISWYHDPALHRCLRFVYTGCDGNGNRFATEEECSDFCSPQVDIVLTPAPTRTDGNVCTMPFDRGTCSNWKIFWYYNSEKRHCTRFYYGSCGGNRNRFSDEEECKARCMQQSEITTTTPAPRRRQCEYSRFGCCPDGLTPAVDAFSTNCRDNSLIVRPDGDGKVVLAVRGAKTFIHCYSPGSAVTWFRDGFFLKSDDRFTLHNNGTIVIRDTDDDVSGHYSCRINDGNNIPQEHRYELKIKVPLTILQTRPTISVGPGETAVLHCQVLGTPKPSVEWSFRGAPVRSGGRFTVYYNGTMVVSGVTPNDVGDYQCTAQNGVDAPISRTLKLLIAKDLRAVIGKYNGTVNEGDTARLSCAVSGYPPPVLRWEKDGSPLSNNFSDKVYMEGNTLVIQRVTIEDAGMYECVAQNSLGSARDRTYMQVKISSYQDKCTDRIGINKCSLIVSAKLCGHMTYKKICCASCHFAEMRKKQINRRLV